MNLIVAKVTLSFCLLASLEISCQAARYTYAPEQPSILEFGSDEGEVNRTVTLPCYCSGNTDTAMQGVENEITEDPHCYKNNLWGFNDVWYNIASLANVLYGAIARKYATDSNSYICSFWDMQYQADGATYRVGFYEASSNGQCDTVLTQIEVDKLVRTGLNWLYEHRATRGCIEIDNSGSWSGYIALTTDGWDPARLPCTTVGIIFKNYT
ncbi:hypothetical protein V1525DRAFT_80888 [Lipomyces kononenkoae]|uniref:Uncharacterized protein n=1 Tax=Lipomyces kononenkoae TaxID=34357 RepID=A0ACC3T5B2_LIPKO